MIGLAFYTLIGVCMAVGCARAYKLKYNEWPHWLILAGTVLFWPFLIIDAATKRR